VLIQSVDATEVLEAFHNLLHLSSVFFQKDDNTTVNADAFPVLNALKEVHLILSQGAHNQFGDLPVTARIEMLMSNRRLAPGDARNSFAVARVYRLSRRLMGPVDLRRPSRVGRTRRRCITTAVFGEQILLSIRYNQWS
jgi:hypothetical protein